MSTTYERAKNIDTKALSEFLSKKFGFSFPKIDFSISMTDESKYVNFSGLDADRAGRFTINPISIKLSTDSLGIFSSMLDNVSIELFKGVEPISINEDRLYFNSYMTIKFFNKFFNEEEFYTSSLRLVYNDYAPNQLWTFS